VLRRFGGKPDRNRPLGRPRLRREDKVKIIFKKWGGGMDWIYLAQDWDSFVGFYECDNEPSRSIKCGKFLD
jgi:hypothetical protein